MDQLLIQRTRYLLRARFRRTQTCPDVMFVNACQQLITWIHNHPLLRFVISELLLEENDQVSQINKTILETSEKTSSYDPGKYDADSSLEHSAICYALVKGISGLGHLDKNKQQFVLCNLGEYLNGDYHIKPDDAVSVLRDVAVDGFYEYLDEHLDERNAIYSLLIKYKQRSEWFRKSRLREYAEKGLENKTGERALAIDVQEYILDQGVEFYVEPASSSGEADMIIKSSEGRHIIVDAKYVKDDSNRSNTCSKLASGFHQVARYCSDFNVAEGFLVNFVANKTRIRLDLSSSDGFPFVQVGSKMIYYIEVNIAEEPSASKSGKATEIEIGRDELISLISASSHKS